MKPKLYSVITLLTFITLVFVSNGFTQQTLLEPSVRFIYFLPNDRPARPDRIEALRQLIKDVQQFYADQMENHGYSRKTFAVETDRIGEPLVHHIDGQFTEEYYYKEGTGYKIWTEIREHFDNFQHIYFTIIDLSSEMLHNGQTCGEASLTYFPQGEESIQWRMRNITQQEEVVSGGFAVIPASGDCFEDNRGYRHRLGTAVHELGHAFGLEHDFREGQDSDYVMAYGTQSRLSMCAAEWLSVSRFFNTRPTLHNDPAEIQLLSSLPTNQDEISLRFEVTDPDGLHQVQLLVADFFEGAGWGPHRLFKCKQLNGETSIVESVIKAAELIDTVTLQITDVSGQITWATFFVDVASLPPPPLTFTPNEIAPQTFIVGTPVNLTLPSATGGTVPYTYTLSSIPAGLQFDTATRVLSGTPTTAGTTTATYTATDAANVSASLTFTITVRDKPTFNPSVIADQTFTVGTSVSLTLPIATGGTAPYTYTLAPLPGGLSFNATERELSGTPTTAGTTATTYTATDTASVSTSLTFTITVRDKPTFNPSVIADQTFTVGEAVNLILPVATGGTPPYTYTLAPLPGGLSFNATERELSGTPTTAERISVTYTATDAVNVSASLTFTIEVTEGVILDVNGDGQVTVLDLAIVALFYGTQVPADTRLPADVNTDGIVDILDLTAVAQGIDTTGGDQFSVKEVEQAVLIAAEQAAELEATAGAPMRIGASGTAAFLSARLAAKNVADALVAVRTNVRLRKSIPAMLEAFLALLTEITTTPDTTALLPNYPNPFNPETWIPYHLAKAANVTVTIYDIRGVAVRQLMLGHQPAGVYRSKHRAAYWDGRNDEGEPVASGLYFYTLRTGDFAATRKLIIRK